MSLSSYEEQRFDRLSDVVSDYLADETGSAEKFLQDLNAALSEMVDYHQKRLEEYNKVLDKTQPRPDVQG